MRILLASTVHNCLSQSVQLKLAALGHEMAVSVVKNGQSIIAAAKRFQPDLIIAPMLKSKIPESVWSRYTCLIVHPGIKGDRGPSSLDWAISEGESRWGVTLLQANQDMDAGDIWAWREFPIRRGASKASIYRHEVTNAAIACIQEAIDTMHSGQLRTEPLDYQRPDVRGRLRPAMRQAGRSIDWSASTDSVLARLRAADSQPGVFESIHGAGVYFFGPVRGPRVEAEPGSWLACRDGALCRATGDGSVWIRQARVLPPHGSGIKLPAGDALADVPGFSTLSDFANPLPDDDWREISYHESDGVGYLNFDFYNGAMSALQCRRLIRALQQAARRDARVLVLSGGLDFWSNGINLNNIEAAAAPGNESWENINAIDDLVREIIGQTDRIVISAVHGNAGAGGVTMALAADEVLVRRGVVLNPHYRGMGELFGSEYWTYLMPRRVGEDVAFSLWNDCQPIDAETAVAVGLVDRALDGWGDDFLVEVREHAGRIADDPQLTRRIAEKKRKRDHDEARRPLADYRADEMQRLAASFDDPESPYHMARRAFVMKLPDEAKPAYWRVPQREIPVGPDPVGTWRAVWQRMLGTRLPVTAARRI